MENIFIQPPVATIIWGSNFKYENKLINLSLCQFIGKVESDTRFGIRFDFQDKEHTWFFGTKEARESAFGKIQRVYSKTFTAI